MEHVINDIKNFRESLFELEAETCKHKEVKTSKLIEIIQSFSNCYRSVDTESAPLRWKEYCSILSHSLTMWANSNSSVSHDQLIFLAKHKSVLSSIFLAGHDAEQRALLRCYKKENNFKQNFTKILLLISINNLNRDLFKAYQNAPHQEALYLSVGWLSERSQMTKQAAVYHQKLVDDFKRFDDLLIDLDFIPFLSKAYMYTTYSSSFGKDTIKATIHKLISGAIIKVSDQKALNFCRNSIRDLPRVAVIHEYFSDTHVMMRCHLPIISELDANFDVYNLTWSNEVYTESAKKVEKVITCEDNISSIIATLKELQPDVILYPSVGMNTLVIALASLRLAPLQLQLFGHPSSTNSPVIDGSLHNNELGFVNSGPEVFSTYEGYRAGMYMPFTLKPISEDVKNKPVSKLSGNLNVSINAKIMKLCPEFMMFLRKVNWPENTILNFFPAETGIEFLGCTNTIQRYFPKAKVHQMTDYETFMREMSTQDLAICAFPFGNTNGILDCLHLSLPTFVLKGREICSAPESQILTAYGLDDYIYRNKSSLTAAVEKFLLDANWRESVRCDFSARSGKYRSKNDSTSGIKYEARNHVEWIKNFVDKFNKQKLTSQFEGNYFLNIA